MNFFRSVFADEPDPSPPKSASDSQTPPEHPSNSDSDSDSPPIQPHSNLNPNPASDGGGWSSFGGLIRTLTTKSESVIETYRRDLKEFSTGLRKEIEVAQGSLENVGHAIDEIGTSVIKGTAQIISHGKEAILSLDQESDSSDADRGSGAAGQSSSYDSRRYSRFDAQVRAIQGDASTFCDEPEDSDDYGKWRSSEFVIQENREDIESLLEENGTLDAIYKKVVPGSVDEETFWSRYYYRIYKLKQAEALRANLVKRAISAEEEDLSWDVDDDGDNDDEGEEWKSKAIKGKDESSGDLEENQEVKKRDCSVEVGKADAFKPVEQNPIEDKNMMGDGKSEAIVQNVEEETVCATPTVEEPSAATATATATASASGNADEIIKEEMKSAENSGSEGNGGNGGGSCKDSDYSVISSHQTGGEEEDVGWDEIEDLSGLDDDSGKKEENERRVSQSGSSSATKEELRKRLSVAAEEEEEDEDLSWDIEEEDDDDDDNKPVKA